MPFVEGRDLLRVMSALATKYLDLPGVCAGYDLEVFSRTIG
jgi:hypothetical protein